VGRLLIRGNVNSKHLPGAGRVTHQAGQCNRLTAPVRNRLLTETRVTLLAFAIINLNASYFGLAKNCSSYAFFRTSTVSFFSIFSENNPFRL
jgi:hypothetical protein